MGDCTVSENDNIARAEQAALAWARFIEPAFEVVRSDYESKLTKLYGEVGDAKSDRACTKLALGVRVLNEVQSQIQALIMNGEVEKMNRRRADAVANLPTHKKLGISLS
jgi:hypothetical protein